MKLIYTWIEKYRNLEKIGLNWDNEFEVEFTEDTQTINIKKNDDYFNLFSDYSCIENIKVIVGKNGTGKTNIMHLLGNGINNCDLLNPSVSDLFLNIYHYKNNEYIIEGNGMINLIINHSIDNHKTYCILAEYEDKEKRFKYKEPFNGYRNEISFVIYFNRLNSISNIPNKRDNIKRFAFRRTENNLIQKCDFIYNINSSDVQQKKYLEQIFTFQKNINLCINVLNFNIVEELKEILDKIKENQPNKKKSFIIKFLKSYIHKIFKEIITVNEEIININEQTVESIIKELHVIKHFDDQAYLEEICDKLSKMLLKRLLKTDFKKLYIDKENTHLKLYDKAYKEFICFFNKIDERLIEDNIEFEFTKHFEYIKEFSKLYDKYVSKESGYIHADFSNLSTGEEDIINLFSVIYHAINIQTLKNNKHVTILLDEPNNFMHPEWSRKLIFILLEFLKDVSNKSKQKYTIICTTHSPFLLSDLHTNQIIALDTNKEKKVVIKSNLEKTFASNIHTLFSDSFFMETTIGEFARQKINFLIKRLNDDNSNKDKKLSENEKRDFKYIIELMGEPLIALKLNEMYMKAIKDDQESKNNLLEENIKLKEYIKKLEVRELENRFRRSDENDKNL